MSGDEEVVSKSNALCAYLIDQGYSDFETFEAKPPDSNHKLSWNKASPSVNALNLNGKNICNEKPDSIEMSSDDHYRLCSILNSRLLFQEDVDIIQAITSNIFIQQRSSNMIWYTCAGLASLLSSAIVLRKRTHVYFSFSVTSLSVFYAVFSAWRYTKRWHELYDNNMLETHVNMLRRLCSNIHKMFRSIKETEILSYGQISIHNVGSAMYIKPDETMELDKLPVWKTVPYIRQHLVKGLLSTINTLLFANESINQNLPSWLVDSNHVSSKETLTTIELILNSGHCVSIKDITKLNDIYLIYQSEYLRGIALLLSATVWRNSLELKNNSKKEGFEILSKVHSELNNVCFTLMMQYNIHHTSSDNKIKINKSLEYDKNGMTNLQNEIHNIFLLSLLLLTKARNLEDYLENLSEKDIKQNNFITDVQKQLSALKDDFTSAEKYLAAICHQVAHKNKNDCEIGVSLEDNTLKSTAETKSRPTGISVGRSDFNVNSPDEVYLAVSGLNLEDNVNCDIDDWCLEKKPQIPKNLLTELSQMLRSRKKDFSERERIALERQGLQDIEMNDDHLLSFKKDRDTDDSSKESHIEKRKIKRKKHINISNICSSSGEEGDLFKKDRKISTKLKSYKKYQANVNSDLDISSSDDGSPNMNITFKNENTNNKVNSSSLANIIAMKSQMWGSKTEECFSDG